MKYLVAFLLLLSTTAWALDDPQTLAIGSPAPEFSLPGIDGKTYTLKDFASSKILLIVFTCNHCPFAKLYQERMNELNATYSPKGFPLLAVSSNDAEAVPEDGFDAMKERAKEKHYNFPYLYDEQQEVARAFGAVKTPHAFVVVKDNGKWVLRYSGAIDDNGSEPDKVKTKFVEEAVDALLAGRTVAITSTKSVGCAIKWRQRKDSDK